MPKWLLWVAGSVGAALFGFVEWRTRRAVAKARQEAGDGEKLSSAVREYRRDAADARGEADAAREVVEQQTRVEDLGEAQRQETSEKLEAYDARREAIRAGSAEPRTGEAVAESLAESAAKFEKQRGR